MRLEVNFNEYGAVNPNETETNFTVLSNYMDGYPTKTKYHCWWCTYPFDTPPIGLPKRKRGETTEFQVVGNFCSFGCMLAFAKDDSKWSVTTGDIIYFYRKMTGRSDVNYSDRKVVPAPSRYLLEKFGGRMRIEEYRKLSSPGESIPEIEMFLAPQVPLSFTVSVGGKPLENTNDLTIKMANLTINKHQSKERPGKKGVSSTTKIKSKRTTVGQMVSFVS